jgi:hypothetical protein
MSPIMQDTQIEERAENQQKEASVRQSAAKSQFDDAEYERWSQNLRNKHSKNK